MVEKANDKKPTLYAPQDFVMKIFISLALAGLLSACTSLLPTNQEQSLQPWKTFEAAKASYDKIEPFITDLDTVRTLGFDPYKTPNMRILNHAQVVQAVLPQPIQDESLIPPGIYQCIKAREACQGYYMEPNRLHKKRVGNFMLDFMNFKRKTITTGWKFGALIVIVGDRVVYKQWSGSPNIEEETLQRNPLGPFQGSGSSPGLYR
ncbi:MAG: hypothetical protein B7Y41_08375 [Hydrogenophilales bacterium 28-61-23]|nr:MAG: hypothetical protein B7Y41_08375 [Hydrogenophilales bacterium 28-61-23]